MSGQGSNGYMLFSFALRVRASGGTQTLSSGPVASRQTYGDAHCSQPYCRRQHNALPVHLFSAGHMDSQMFLLGLQLATSFVCAGVQGLSL